MESVETRIARLAPQIEAYRTGASTEISDFRKESLALAHAANVTDAIFTRLAGELLVSRAPVIVLPAHRYEKLSRGRGWARKGRGAAAEWGERCDGGYRVGPGRWTIGGNDGFARKGEDAWDVGSVPVGAEIWTVAS